MGQALNPSQTLSLFITQHQLIDKPFLLALSGGVDSLCLFYCLLELQKKVPFIFHIAHVNHGWREESIEEERALCLLAKKNHIDFYSTKLNLNGRKGNLEEISRKERYGFFKDLCNKHGYSGILTGHHADDQAETILKRVLEGAHWAHFNGLSSEMNVYGVIVFRPFLSHTKQELVDCLSQSNFIPFDDRTNKDTKFLRARMRETLIPLLSQEFGKQIHKPLVHLGHDAKELAAYFDGKVGVYLEKIISGPLGSYIDVPKGLPRIEIKYLVRKWCEIYELCISREEIEKTADLIDLGQANKEIGKGLFVDRNKLFYIPFFPKWQHMQTLEIGQYKNGDWDICVEEVGEGDDNGKSWEDNWGETFTIRIQKNNYVIDMASPNASYQNRSLTISKWWNNHKVPAILRNCIPVIWEKDTVVHEFLTGKGGRVQTDEEFLKITLKYVGKMN